MIALIQRVSQAAVAVDGSTIGAINSGLLILLGVEKDDDQQTAKRLCEKVIGYRIFSDPQGKMNLNVQQAGGSLLVVSQFTLAADTKRYASKLFWRSGASSCRAAVSTFCAAMS